MMKKDCIREFPWQKIVHPDYASVIPKAADGSPYGDLYVESRAFDTFLYRTEPLTVIKEFREIEHISEIEHGIRKPRAFRLTKASHSYIPKTVLKSADMIISILMTNPVHSIGPGLRNGDANEIYFVHEGNGTFYTDFGSINYKTGDYIFLPKGTTYNITTPCISLFVIAAIPKQVFMPCHSWLSDFFPYDLSALIPALPYAKESIKTRKHTIFETSLKTNGSYDAKIVHPFSPFNCVGWQGKLYPFKLSLEHIHTLSSPTFHLPPIALITFTTEDMSAMISTFKPRWIHSLPYNHMNDHEEFLFYHAGEYGARTNIRLGDATLHPVGVHHGPQPNRMKAWKKTEPKNLPWREETAIMFESLAPFSMTTKGKDIEIEDYDVSWNKEWEQTEENSWVDECSRSGEDR